MGATYGQVKDILKAAIGFHRDLERFYSQCEAKVDRQRVQMLLDYLRREETEFEEALTEMHDEDQKKLLETWMQYAPDDRALAVPQAEELRGALTVEDLADLALRLEEQLAVFYTQAAEMAKPPEVKNLFSRLAEQQEDRRREFKVNARLTQGM